jgi:hypothetical protein
MEKIKTNFSLQNRRKINKIKKIKNIFFVGKSEKNN